MSASSLADKLRAQHPELFAEWQRLHEGVNDNASVQQTLAAYDALLERLIHETPVSDSLPFYRTDVTYVRPGSGLGGDNVSNVVRNLCRLHTLYA
jgi:hypothetical protein